MMESAARSVIYELERLKLDRQVVLSLRFVPGSIVGSWKEELDKEKESDRQKRKKDVKMVTIGGSRDENKPDKS
ncbi:hypothetical protein NDU88_002255 [Pleurodeles waltl]|uniref:Uncharacterized protein n=1 Tax=Pleurodeles waltl TaxID=8319 RepID=A0AAV7TK33_PLEWA|nr:hypothetical protein NDU88_002255 [Pleurodeles waltl]